MVQAHVQDGRLEIRDPIPPEWEGLWVKIVPLTPDDPIPDLEQQLAALHALGAIEYEDGEQESLRAALDQLDAAGKTAMEALGRSHS